MSGGMVKLFKKKFVTQISCLISFIYLVQAKPHKSLFYYDDILFKSRKCQLGYAIGYAHSRVGNLVVNYVR